MFNRTPTPGNGQLAPTKPPAGNGMEVLLRSLLPKEFLEALQKLASQGTIEKIIQFVDNTEGMKNELRELRSEIVGLREAMETDTGGNKQSLSSAKRISARGAANSQPGSDPGDSRFVADGIRRDVATEHVPSGKSGSGRKSGGAPDIQRPKTETGA